MQKKLIYDYVGWVPCLNGELVFDLIECGLNAKNDSVEIIHHDNDDNQKLQEYILLSSTVNWKDFDDNEVETGLWSVFLLSTRTLDSKQHQGCLYFVPNIKGSTEQLENITEAVRNLNIQINTEAEVDVPAVFSNLKQKLSKICLATLGCYHADFILEHDGIVWVGPSPIDEDDRKVIARQAYYYIKYSWHKHQHHDTRAETLTTIHKVIHGSNRDGEIAEKLVGDLKRNLVKFKREIDHTSHREILKAKGIVTYAKALVEIMRSKQFIKDDFYNREINHLEFFQESLDISSAGIEKDMSLHSQAVNDARAIILFVFAMITPALIVNSAGIKEGYSDSAIPSYIQWISNLYATNINFAVILGVVSFFLFLYISTNSHYGNFWIFLSGFKKSVSFIVKDRAPKEFLSNTNVMCAVLLVLGFLSVAFGIHGLFEVLYKP